MSLADEVGSLFAGFQMDAVDNHQLDLFTYALRRQQERRESHRERQRVAQAIRTASTRRATNAQRAPYWREYRRQERAAKPDLVARDREASRLRAARYRASARAA